MTENRYSINLLTGDIFDTVTNEFIKGSGIVRRLNELNEENQQLKIELEECRNNKLFSRRELERKNKELKEKFEFARVLANHRGEMVSFANALIQDLDDEKTQDMWEKFKDGMYKEWKQKRGIE